MNLSSLLPPIFGGTKTLSKDIEWLKGGVVAKGKAIGDVFSAEGYQAGGDWYRKAATSRLSSFSTGLFGLGTTEYLTGKEGWVPDWGRPGEGKAVLDTSGNGGGLVNIDIPDFPKLVIPEFPNIVIPEFPNLVIPEFPDVSGLLGGLQMPEVNVQIPGITDGDGGISTPIMIGAAAIALAVILGRK